jgi:hypothetical protein
MLQAAALTVGLVIAAPLWLFATTNVLDGRV